MQKNTQDIREISESHKWLASTVINGKNLTSPEVISNMKTQVDKLEQMQANMKRLQDTLKQTSTKTGDNVRRIITQIAGLETRVDNSGLDKISGKLEKMQNANDEKIGQLGKQMEKKPDREDVMGIDRRITQQIHDITEHIERYAEKEDVIKKIVQIEKQIKRIENQRNQN